VPPEQVGWTRREGSDLEPVLLIAGVVLAAAALLLAVVLVTSRFAKRRRTRDVFTSLSALRSETGRPFFPQTPEEMRIEKRILAGWDPTYEGGEGADPKGW
jgi:hypothetical protein